MDLNCPRLWRHDSPPGGPPAPMVMGAVGVKKHRQAYIENRSRKKKSPLQIFLTPILAGCLVLHARPSIVRPSIVRGGGGGDGSKWRESVRVRCTEGVGGGNLAASAGGECWCCLCMQPMTYTLLLISNSAWMLYKNDCEG